MQTEGEVDEKERAGQLIGANLIKGGGWLFFFSKGQHKENYYFYSPSSLCTQVSRVSSFQGEMKAARRRASNKKSAKRSQTNLQMNHIKGDVPIVSPLVSAENWLIKGKKMTLFTLARALISASHVCCVAPPSAYQQTTSAALHNRCFEGFLSEEKRIWRE